MVVPDDGKAGAVLVRQEEDMGAKPSAVPVMANATAHSVEYFIMVTVGGECFSLEAMMTMKRCQLTLVST